MPAARAGWRLDSWDMLTSSIYHTQACRLGREGFCNTLSGSDRAALLQVKKKKKGASYHDLAGDVTYFSISESVQLFGCRHASPLKEKTRISKWEQNVNLRSKKKIKPLRELYHVINSKQRIICLLIDRGHLQCQL